MRSKIAALLLAVVVLAGCGSNDNAEPAAETTTSASVAPANEDEVLAKKLVLVNSDFPAGWNASVNTPLTTGIATASARLWTCIGRPDPGTTASANANGQAFGRSGNNVTSSVQISRDAADAALDAKAMGGSKVVECLKPIIDVEIENQFGHLRSNGATITSTIEPVNDVLQSERKGDDIVFGWRFSAEMVIGGQTSRLYADYVGFQHGRAQGTAYFGFLQQPPDKQLQQQLLGAMYKRAVDVTA